MAKRRYRSARGESIDFDLLQHHNKDTIAVGNANMNANGDIIGRGGKIVRKAEDIPAVQMADPNAAYNQSNPKSTKMVSLKDKVDVLEKEHPVLEDEPEELMVAETKAEEPVEKKPEASKEESKEESKEKPKTKRKIVDSEE